MTVRNCVISTFAICIEVPQAYFVTNYIRLNPMVYIQFIRSCSEYFFALKCMPNEIWVNSTLSKDY